jgi:hypothetical protein
MTQIDDQPLLIEISNLTVINQIIETIYVSDSVGQIEINKITKEDDFIRNINEVIDFKLKSHRLIVKCNEELQVIISDVPYSKNTCSRKSVCQQISSDINKIFINELKDFKNIEKDEYKFFNQNFLKRILNPNTEYNLVNKLLSFGHGCSWMIVPVFLYDIIKDSRLFESSYNKSGSLIYQVGILNNIVIYLNPDQDESFVFYGNYDSAAIILNKKIKEDVIKSTLVFSESKSIKIEYQFIELGKTKMLHII